MLWEVEILPKLHDPESERVRQEVALLTHGSQGEGCTSTSPRAASCSKASSRARLLNGCSAELFFFRSTRWKPGGILPSQRQSGKKGSDWIYRFAPAVNLQAKRLINTAPLATVLKPGVMDPVAESVELARSRSWNRFILRAHLSPLLCFQTAG